MSSIATETRELRDILARGIATVDVEFAFDEAVQPPKLPIAEGTEHWAGLTVQLLGVALTKTDFEGLLTDDEEPFFVSFAEVDSQGMVKRVGGEDDEVAARAAKRYLNQNVLYTTLGAGSHSVNVVATAFDAGLRDAWAKFFEKLLENGAKEIDALTVFIPGGALAQQTVSGAIAALQETLNHMLFRPDTIGDDQPVLGVSPREWRRKSEQRTPWTAHKYVRFGNDAEKDWYLTLWQITLYATDEDVRRHLPKAPDPVSTTFGWRDSTGGAGAGSGANGHKSQSPTQRPRPQRVRDLKSVRISWATTPRDGAEAVEDGTYALLGIDDGFIHLAPVSGSGDDFFAPIAAVRDLRHDAAGAERASESGSEGGVRPTVEIGAGTAMGPAGSNQQPGE